MHSSTYHSPTTLIILTVQKSLLFLVQDHRYPRLDADQLTFSVLEEGADPL